MTSKRHIYLDIETAPTDDPSEPAQPSATPLKSGQPVPAPKTPSAASRISRLAITSLRKQTRTERMFASPSRDAIRQNHADWVRQQGRDTDDTHNVKPWGPVGDVPDNRAQPEKSHRRASLIPFQALARARAG